MAGQTIEANQIFWTEFPAEPEDANYLARQGLQEAALQHFAGNKQLVKLVCCGPGGIGKSTFAYKVAAELIRNKYYKHYLYIFVNEKQCLLDVISNIAGRMGIAVQNRKSDDWLKDWRDKLWEAESLFWLIDNLDEALDYNTFDLIFPRHLQGAKRCHVLITSRQEQWRRDFIRQEIKAFNPNEAVTFIQQIIPDTSHDEAQLLANAVQRYPLALTLTLGYIQENNYSIKHYLTQVKDNANYSLSQVLENVWHRIYRQLEGKCPEALKIIEQLVFLNTEHIPIELIHEISGGYSPVVEGNLSLLRKQSLLIAVKPGYYKIHSDVSGVIIKYLTLNQKQHLTETSSWQQALHTLTKIYPYFTPDSSYSLEDLEKINLYWPHILAILTYMEEDNLLSLPESYLLNYSQLSSQLALSCALVNATQEQIILLQKILQKLKEIFDNKLLVKEVSNSSRKEISNLYFSILWSQTELAIKLGNYKKSEEYSKNLFRFTKNNTSIDNLNLARAYENRALTLIYLGNYANLQIALARALLLRAKNLKEKCLAPRDIKLSYNYNLLGETYINSGGKNNLAIAKKFYDKALSICTEKLPANHPELALCYLNIAEYYDICGNDEASAKAKELYEKSKHIYEQNLPIDSINLATFYHHLGQHYTNLGGEANLTKAEEYYKKDLEICKQSLPANHPTLASSYYQFGDYYSNLGSESNLIKAKEYYQEALTIRKQCLSKNDLDLANSYYSLGWVHQELGGEANLLQAKVCLKKALAIDKKSLPENDLDLAHSYCSLGSIYLNLGGVVNLQQAKVHHEKALAIRKQRLSENDLELAKSYYNLGRVYQELGGEGNLLQAKEDLEKALAIEEKCLPENDLDLAKSYFNLGRVYQDLGGEANLMQAKKYLEQTIAIYQYNSTDYNSDLQEARDSLFILERQLEDVENMNSYTRMTI